MIQIKKSVVARRCTNPTTVKGIGNIPLELTIAVDVLSIHYDAEIWGPMDPKEFYPPRFSPEIKRHPCAFLSFGVGPRNCIGMKFAILELKIALIKLINEYEIEATENTPDELDFTEGVVRVPKGGVNVLVRKRVINAF